MTYQELLELKNKRALKVKEGEDLLKKKDFAAHKNLMGEVAKMNVEIDAAEARQIALDTAGGGEVIGQEISSEGLWNEYSYVIVNGSTWYDIEVSGFGRVTELESGTGTYRD